MTNSKTLNYLNRFYEIAKNAPQSEEERDFVDLKEIGLAKSLIQDFGIESAATIAKIITAISK